MKKFYLTMLALAGFVLQASADVTYTMLSATKTNNNEGAEKLLDGQGSTKWGEGLNNGDTRWIVFKASAGIMPSDYVLTVANDTPGSQGRQWQKWRIYGANFASDVSATRNADGWVLLDSKENITDEEFPTGTENNSYLQTTFTLSEGCTTYYEYFKIEVDEIRQSGQYMQMGDFAFGTYTEETTAELYTTKVNIAKSVAISDELGTEDVWYVEAQNSAGGFDEALADAQSADDYTALQSKLDSFLKLNAAIAALASNGKVGAFDGSACWGDGHYSQLFDGKDGISPNEGTKWGGNFDGAAYQYVIFRVKDAFAPYFYKLVTGGDTQRFNGRNWKTWTVYGANFTSFADATKDAEGWVELDKREDISEKYLPMESNYPAAFNFNQGVNEPYLYFMVKVFAAHEGDAIQMNEMVLCTQEEFEAVRTPLVAAFDGFDFEGLVVESSVEADKATFAALLEELKTTADAVRMTEVYNELVELRKKLEESAAFLAGGFRCLEGNTAWGDNENWTKLVDGDITTKWGGDMPEEGSYVIFKTYAANAFNQYVLVTGNDTKNSPGRNWKTWKIYGANVKGDMDEYATRDFGSWTLIDEKTDIGQDRLPAGNFLPAYFSFTNPKSFKYYKIEVEAAYDGGSIQMSEFKMLSDEEYAAIRQEYVDSLGTLKAEVTGDNELTEAVAAEVQAAVDAVAAASADELLPAFAAAREVVLGALKKSSIEIAQGDAECILPSMKWGGSYKAWTYVAQGDFDYGDWNESNPNYNVIIGTPANKDGKAWYMPDYDVTGWNYGQDLPNFGDGRPADVYAVRYFTVEGEIPSTLYMPAAHDDAPCEYYINGELIWSETDGWYEDEVVRLTDEQKALIKADGTVNVFAFHVHQNWGGRYADGGLYTAGSPVDAFNNDGNKPALEATIALAESEGIDAEVIEFAKAKSNYRGGMSKGLAQLRKARRLAFDARTEDFAGTEPADGLVAYIFNVGAKMFLAGGNDWGTHASLNHMGAKCVLHANSSGENRYAIQTNLPNGLRGANDGLGHNGYVDCGYGDDFTTAQGWAWEFKALEDGTYNIINADNNLYLGMTDDDRLQVDTDKAADNPYNAWIFVTPEEFEALAAEATKDNPVDLGHLVHQATFSQNDFDGNDKGAANADLNDSKWERNAGSIWNWKGNSAGGDYMFEMWNTKDVGKVYLSQEVEGLPAGKYTVQMNGYYRDGNFESADEGNVRQLAYLFAGDESNCVPLKSIVEGSGNYPGLGRGGASGIVIPDGCAAAAKFFQVGTYVNTIEAEVGEDGKLKIGVYRDAEDVKGGDWITTDNWRLYYKGIYVDAAITDAGYATFVAPWNIDEIPAGVEAYAAQVVKNNYVHLEPVTAIPAGEAVVLKGEEGVYTMTPAADVVELGADNDLVAATEEVTADGTQYILAKQEDAVGFAKATPDSKIAAGKGYLVIAPAADVKEFYPFGDDATGVKSIETVTTENAIIYNLAGQRIGKMQKGVNIVGGKKILK